MLEMCIITQILLLQILSRSKKNVMLFQWCEAVAQGHPWSFANLHAMATQHHAQPWARTQECWSGEALTLCSY